jgi:hypothetical protein
MSSPPELWSVAAVNLPVHADNPVHTVEGGIAAGYRGAVVAGVTVYGYITRPIVEAWGAGWLSQGRAQVAFKSATLADEQLDVVPMQEGDGWTVEALHAGEVRARARVFRGHDGVADPVGDQLEPLVEVLSPNWIDQPRDSGEDLAIYEREEIVHPAVWTMLANRVFTTQLVDGPWVHTRSDVRHLGLARPGETAVIESWVTDRFTTRAGERVVTDIRIDVDGRPIAAIEHEAIVRLAERA